MFGSIMTLGGLIGAVFSGKISDVLGRKRVSNLVMSSSKYLVDRLTNTKSIYIHTNDNCLFHNNWKTDNVSL